MMQHQSTKNSYKTEIYCVNTRGQTQHRPFMRFISSCMYLRMIYLPLWSLRCIYIKFKNSAITSTEFKYDVSVFAMKAYTESRVGVLLDSFLTLALYWGDQLHASTALPSGKNPPYQMQFLPPKDHKTSASPLQGPVG